MLYFHYRILFLFGSDAIAISVNITTSSRLTVRIFSARCWYRLGLITWMWTSVCIACIRNGFPSHLYVADWNYLGYKVTMIRTELIRVCHRCLGRTHLVSCLWVAFILLLILILRMIIWAAKEVKLLTRCAANCGSIAIYVLFVYLFYLTHTFVILWCLFLFSKHLSPRALIICMQLRWRIFITTPS